MVLTPAFARRAQASSEPAGSSGVCARLAVQAVNANTKGSWERGARTPLQHRVRDGAKHRG